MFCQASLWGVADPCRAEFALRQTQHEMLSYCIVRIAPFTLSLSKSECSIERDSTVLNEADTRAKLIDPKLKAAGWGESQIEREHYFQKGRAFTAGRIYLVGE